MKLKPQRPRSCLGWFAWVFAILLMLFAISYTIDMARLANAWREADALAARLGYTPERHLTDKGSTQLNHLLFGTAICRVRVFFTTPLDPSDFAVNVEQLTHPGFYKSAQGRSMYVKIALTVNKKEANDLYRTSRDELPPVNEHKWLVLEDSGSVKQEIFYSELSQANVEIEYKGRPITENVAYVGVDAGSFPFWVWIGC